MRRTRPASGELVLLFLVALAQWTVGLADTPASSQAIQAHIEQRLVTLQANGQLELRGAAVAAVAVLPAIYQARAYRPLWTESGRIDELLALLASAPRHGLETRDYHLEHLRALRASREEGLSSAQRLGDFDLLLSDALARFGYHQLFGKIDPTSFDANINFSRDFIDTDGVIEALPRIVASGRPFREVLDEAVRHPDVYRQLQAELVRHREIAKRQGWPSVPPGPSLRRGDRGPRVLALRARLAADGAPNLDAALDSAQFDTGLEAAVRQYQHRHGLAADGVAGRRTVASLNVAATVRVDQIRLSLERLRWVQEELGPEFVAVNIAGFRVFMVRDRQIAWSARVMVGRPYRQTPVFRGELAYLELNPTWTVPPSILRMDVLPAVKKDTGYLAAKNISVLDRAGNEIDPETVDWNAYSNDVPYTLRQEPGPSNALGRIKFIFPNKHLVYLHDTPNRTLFDRPERAFSSGCIRVERPLELADLLLEHRPDWNGQRLRSALATHETRRIELANKTPVLIVYLTASVDKQGHARFYRDIYQRDERLLEALNGPVVIRFPSG